MLMGLFGAALFYGDGTITPAISVLSAVEGLEVATPAFKPYVIPLTLVVLVVLFAVQKRGTGSVGALFGPIMMLWFVTLAVLGVMGILRAPQVLFALNPLYAVGFLYGHPMLGFFALGGVVLAVTGAEALYADMGHFGALPVRTCLVGPRAARADAQLLRPGRAAAGRSRRRSRTRSTCWHRHGRCIRSSRYPRSPTIIASQAVISGAFSITQQAMQLGYAPRMELEHTSSAPDGADLRAGHQSRAVPRRRRAGAGLRLVDQPRGRVRHRGHRYHGHHTRSLRSSWRAGCGSGASSRALRFSARSCSSTLVSSAPTSSRSSTAAGSRWRSVPACSSSCRRGSAAASC